MEPVWMTIAVVGAVVGLVGIAIEFVRMRRYTRKRKESDDLARHAVDALLMGNVDRAKRYAQQAHDIHEEALDILIGKKE